MEQKIIEIEKQLTNVLLQETLLFLIKGDNILLAMKKRGFGEGRFNGVGGKVKKHETEVEAVLRETHEEIGVIPLKFEKVANLKFYFSDKPNWHRQVHAYLCQSWEGKIKESEEMKPKWFKTNKLPFDKMWSDDPLWLPHAIGGKLVDASFLFGPKDIVLDYKIKVK